MSERKRERPATTIANQIQVAAARSSGPQRKTTGWREAGAQIRAGSMGAADVIAFGKGKEIEAARLAGLALGGPSMAIFHPREFKQLYDVALRALEQQEAYDAQHRKAARRTGQVAGAVVSVVGAPEIAAVRGLANGGRAVVGLAGGARVANTAANAGRAANGAAKTARVARPARGASPVLAGPGRLATPTANTIAGKLGGTTAIAAGGGLVVGGGGELVSQGIKRDFDLRDLGAASAGGVIDGLVTKAAGSSIGGAFGGVTDTVLRGNPTADDIFQALGNGALLGRTGRFVGSGTADNLKPKEKGLVGEQLSIFKALAEGRMPRAAAEKGSNELGPRFLTPIADGRKQKAYAKDREPIPDLYFEDGLYREAKFGRWADLSPAQRALFNDPLQRLDVDHWDPLHIGNSLGVAMSAAGTPILHQDYQPPFKVSATEWFDPRGPHRLGP